MRTGIAASRSVAPRCASNCPAGTPKSGGLSFHRKRLRASCTPGSTACVNTIDALHRLKREFRLLCALSALVGCADARASSNTAMGIAEMQQVEREIVMSRVMVDPASVSDELGEWIELANRGHKPVDLRGWHLRSARDPGFTVPTSLIIPPSGRVVLGRSGDAATNGGIRVDLVYAGIVLANSKDWVVLANPAGVAMDSVAWAKAPRGKAIERGGRSAPLGETDRVNATSRPVAPDPERTPPPLDTIGTQMPSEVVVRVLDIGQGDAVLIQNGGSTILVDGGPTPAGLGQYLDVLALNGTTIDAVILTHVHADHYKGLRELFASRRQIAVRYFWENQDPSSNVTLRKLRDSIAARVPLGLVYRDTDDPCANGSSICTINLKGGAKLHILRPDPEGRGANNRSPALKLVGADSASFTMWMAGDAETDEIQWFTRTGYRRNPGMRVDVLKADHHGSCNGVTDLYLDELRPSLLVASLAAVNDYGHMHAQAKAMYARHGIPWYRTDQNGMITLRSAGTPGSGYSVTMERGGKNLSGPSDRRSTSRECGR